MIRAVAALVLLFAAPSLGSVSVSWTFSNDNSTITFSVRGQGVSGWVGIGISDNSVMPASDILWARSSGSSVVVEDAYATSHSTPARDSSQDITVLSAGLEDSSIAFEVSRPLISADSRDIDIELQFPQYLLTAWHPTSASSFSALPFHESRYTVREVMWWADQGALASPSPPPSSEKGVQVSWVVSDDNTTVTFTVRGQDIPGWVAIGVSNSAGMEDTDTIWARSSGSSVEVEDAFCSSHDAPTRDPSQDIQVHFAGLEDSSIVFEVTRPVVSLDTSRDVAIALDQPQYLLVAYNKQGATSFSGLPEHSNTEVYQVSWRDGTLVPRPHHSRAELVHGVLMGISWGVLIPLGMLIARVGKKHKQWFNAHRSVQALALVLAIGGFAVGVDMVDHGHFDHDFHHGKVGVAVMAIGLLQPVIAAVRPKDKTSVPRKRWYAVHAGLGLVGGVLGWANCFTGMDMYDSPAGVRGLLGAFVGLVVAAVVAAEVRKRANPTSPRQKLEGAL